MRRNYISTSTQKVATLRGLSSVDVVMWWRVVIITIQSINGPSGVNFGSSSQNPVSVRGNDISSSAQNVTTSRGVLGVDVIE